MLEARDITVQFGGIRALSGVAVRVLPGRVTGLIGPNGAGKTTLLNTIAGLQSPTQGTVLLDGQDVTDVPVHGRARRGIARTFQHLEVFGSLSVAENVLVSAEIRRRWSKDPDSPRQVTERLLDRLALRPFADHPANAVPTGIARLTEVARVLATSPRIVLLDEPSAGLDERESDALGELLLHLAAEGRAVLLVAHDVELVMRVCTWVDVLDFGRIIAGGPPGVIRADPAVRSAYLGTRGRAA